MRQKCIVHIVVKHNPQGFPLSTVAPGYKLHRAFNHNEFARIFIVFDGRSASLERTQKPEASAPIVAVIPFYGLIMQKNKTVTKRSSKSNVGPIRRSYAPELLPFVFNTSSLRYAWWGHTSTSTLHSTTQGLPRDTADCYGHELPATKTYVGVETGKLDGLCESCRPSTPR